MKLTRVFFATDVHGSEKCWKKFINAAKVYEVDALILGGDLTGKGLVPIFRSREGAKAFFHEKQYLLDSEEKLGKFEKLISTSGYYAYSPTATEFEELRTDSRKLDSLFVSLMKERISQWIKFADERLSATNVKCYVCPGNDDSVEIDELFGGSSAVVNASERITSVDDYHEVVNVGWTNPTPWSTPRECSEEEIAKKIEAQASQLKDVKNSVFQLHAPPYESTLDNAPKLDESMRIVYGETVAVGSTAVRSAIEKYQPLLGLHGHIHESEGAMRIGRTLCINPGSDYITGILRGLVVNLDKSSIKSYYNVSG